MDILQSLPPLVTLALGLLLVIWLVLFLLVPFMLESIRSWSRKSYHELQELNEKLERLTQLLEEHRSAEPPVLLDQHLDPLDEARDQIRPARDSRAERLGRNLRSDDLTAIRAGRAQGWVT